MFNVDYNKLLKDTPNRWGICFDLNQRPFQEFHLEKAFKYFPVGNVQG